MRVMIPKLFRDLALAEPGLRQIDTDICIVGAGAAGIYLACELCRQGRRVVLLEAGPRKGVDSLQIGFDPLFDALPYRGATLGRLFGLGGSTARWGGVLVPHSDHDLRPEVSGNDVWFHIVQTVRSQTAAVLKRLGYKGDADLAAVPEFFSDELVASLTEIGFDVRSNLQMPFLKKNFSQLLGQIPGKHPQPIVVYNAVAKNWSIQSDSSNAQVSSVTAVSRSGAELTVFAKQFVLSAGAIESARILLELHDIGGGTIVRPLASGSCFLADHLSCRIADVDARDRDLAAALFAPRFLGGWMRGFRLLEREVSRETPRAFVHFIFSNPSAGFGLARQMLLAAQARRMPSITVGAVASNASDLLRLVYYRFFRGRLHVPSGTPVHLQLDIEQQITAGNCIRLSSERDSFGRRRASIHWRITENDLSDMRKIARRIFEKWTSIQHVLPQLVPREIDIDELKPHDAYHPVASCRMGDDPDAIVDRDMKVSGVRNLWVSSTGVLPSAGTANPTFTMLCLTHRLAEHLVNSKSSMIFHNV